MKQASEQKKDFFKSTKTKPDIILLGTSTSAQRTNDFANFWKSILQPEQPQSQQELLKGDNNISDVALRLYWGAADDDFTSTHVELTKLLACVPLGRAGGQDGVFGKFIRALGSDHHAVLWGHVAAVLLGQEEVPLWWITVTVTLIPKGPRPVRPSDYRPITVLSVAEKVALKLWPREAQPYTEL